ncbi:MAG: hypothetical protein ACI4DP_00125 [Candidatus Ornithomonoglobus sp.]
MYPSLEGVTALLELAAAAAGSIAFALSFERKDKQQEADASRRMAENKRRYEQEIKEAGWRVQAEMSREAARENIENNPLPDGKHRGSIRFHGMTEKETGEIMRKIKNGELSSKEHRHFLNTTDKQEFVSASAQNYYITPVSKCQAC